MGWNRPTPPDNNSYELDGGEFRAPVPRMGGEVKLRADVDTVQGKIDLYLAPSGGDYGSPLPIRVAPNGDGADVIFVLTRSPGMGDDEWGEAQASMARELVNLKQRLEGWPLRSDPGRRRLCP